MKEFWLKLWGYINIFKKTDPEEKKGQNFNLRAMHTINKISIAMFLGAMIFMLVRWIVRM